MDYLAVAPGAAEGHVGDPGSGGVGELPPQVHAGAVGLRDNGHQQGMAVGINGGRRDSV